LVSTEHITVIGSGYVGLTTGVCLASLGHSVTCVDRDPSAVAALREGSTFLAEHAMSSLLRDALDNDTIRF
jgi:UDPglucose 6-dehydrogenase